MSRNFQLQKNTFYHIYNRGFNKQQLFFDVRDYQKFLANLHKYKKKFAHIDVLSFCILPNHFHFILREKYQKDDEESAEQISSFMQKLQQSYAMFFNSKHKTEGEKLPVFEGRFKAKIIETESYLFQLKMYVEWNAVKHGIVENPEDWEYSSFDPNNPEFDFENMEWEDEDEMEFEV